MASLDTSTSNFSLSYDASDILDENDKSLFLHKRPLLNAETMVKKGHYKSALEIYYRALGKISNQEVQKKLQENITDLHGLLKKADPESEKVFVEKYSDTRGKEFSKSLKQFTENLSDSLTEKLNILKQIDTVPEKDTGNQNYADRATSPPPRQDQSDLKPLDLGSLNANDKPNLDTEKSEPKDSSENLPKEDISNLFSESTEINSDTTPVRSEKSEINSDSSNIDTKSAEIKNESADFKTEGSEIYNETAEIKNETNIQNATLDSKNLQLDSENFTKISGTSSSQESSTQPKSELTNESQSKPLDDKENTVPSESRTIEESKIVKEYKETIDVAPTKESKGGSPKSPNEASVASKSNESKIEESEEELLFSKITKSVDVETGWSELDKDSSKPKADKDYSPVMKKYEVDSIEIPESTEFYTADFLSSQSGTKSDTEDPSISNKDNVLPSTGMIQGIPSGFSGDSSNESDDQRPYQVPSSPPPLPPFNINDWLSSLYFSKDWEQFKPLPIKERRSGKERRSSNSSNLPKGIKKERRSGLDRRKQNVNLLHEREVFLNNLNKANQNLPQQEGFPPLSDYGLPFGENLNQENYDPSLKSLEFLPREPISKETLPNSEDLEKILLPDPNEISKKPQLDQNEVEKDSFSNEMSQSLTPSLPANEELGLIESDKGLVKIQLPDPQLLKAEAMELPQREVSGEIEVSSKDGTGIAGDGNKPSDTSGMGPFPYTPEAYSIPEELKIELPDPDDFLRTKSGHLIDPFAPEETPEINMIDGDGPLDDDGAEISEIPEIPPPPEPERTIHGILELKPPEIDDAPFLTLTYDFSKIPHPFKLSKNYSIMEYSYYKYKPMLMKAQEFARRKMLKNALNYYRVIKSQNIPPELKDMINRNITDITEFLEKFIMSKGG